MISPRFFSTEPLCPHNSLPAKQSSHATARGGGTNQWSADTQNVAKHADCESMANHILGCNQPLLSPSSSVTIFLHSLTATMHLLLPSHSRCVSCSKIHLEQTGQNCMLSDDQCCDLVRCLTKNPFPSHQHSSVVKQHHSQEWEAKSKSCSLVMTRVTIPTQHNPHQARIQCVGVQFDGAHPVMTENSRGVMTRILCRSLAGRKKCWDLVLPGCKPTP